MAKKAAKPAKPPKPPSMNRIRSKGRAVWTVEWDSGGPGAGAGGETIYELDGVFWFPSDEGGLFGPYKTLTDAVTKTDLDMVNGATASVTGSLPVSEVVAMLKAVDLDYGKITEINGELWTYDQPGRFRPTRPEELR